MPQATLYNPQTGQRKAVETSSPQEQALFSQGYFLETSYNPTTGESTYDDPRQTQQNRSMSSLASLMPPAQSEVDVNQTSNQLIDTLGQQSIMGQFFQNTRSSALTQTETAIQNTLTQLEQDRARREAEAQARQNEAATNLEATVTGTSLEDIQRRLITEFGLEDIRNQLQKYKQELVALDEQYQMADLAIQNKPINAAIIRGQRALKQQEYAAKASTVQAKVAIAGEQYDLARDTVNNLFEAAATDRQNTINYYERLYDLERQNLIQLDAEEKDNINASISLIQQADARAQANRENIVALFQDPIMAKAFQQSGADLTMDFDQVMLKMLPFINDENRRLELLKTSASSGGTSISTKFWSAAEKARSDLQKGESWGTVWDRLHLQYPDVPNEVLDTALGGSAAKQVEVPQTQTNAFQSIPPEIMTIPATGFAREGAFEEWKQKQYKQSEPTVFSQQSGVWQWLASDEAAALTNDQKKQEIMAAGFDPEDFGIY